MTSPVVSLRREAMRRFLRHRLAVAGLVVLCLVGLLAAFAPWVSGPAPDTPNLDAVNASPSSEHILGADEIGRDQWSRLVYGARTSLQVGFGAVAITLLIGTVIGVLAGYIGKLVDSTLMRVTDAFMSIPPLLLAIVFVSVAGPSLTSVTIVIALTAWPNTARVVRSQVLALREQEFVVAARVIGVGRRGIITGHLLPNLLGPLSVVATFGVASAILTEAGLSFLGLGVRPPTASWGQMVNAAQSLEVLLHRTWIWLPPSIAICLLVLAVNAIGDGLRDAVDPRSQ